MEHCRNDTDRGKLRYWERNCHSVTWSFTNLHSVLGSNLSVHGEMPATNHLRLSSALVYRSSSKQYTKYPVPTSQRTHCVSTVKTNLLITYREITVFDFTTGNTQMHCVNRMYSYCELAYFIHLINLFSFPKPTNCTDASSCFSKSK